MRKRFFFTTFLICFFFILMFMSACSKDNKNGHAEAFESSSLDGRYVCTGYEKILRNDAGQGNRIFACTDKTVFSCENCFSYRGNSIDSKEIEELVELYDELAVSTKIFRQTIDGKKLSELAFVGELDGYVISAVISDDEELVMTLSSAADYLGLRDEGYLVRINRNGEIIFRKKLEKGTWNGKLTIDGKGNAMIFCGDKIIRYDPKGKELREQRINFTSCVLDICGDENDGFYLIGLEKGATTKHIQGDKEVVIDTEHGFLELSRTHGGNVLAENGEKVFLYTGQGWLELFSFISLDIYSKDVIKWWMGDDGKVYLIVQEGKGQEEYLVLAECKPETQIVSKEVITLGTNGLNEDVQRAVISFNRINEKYRVELINYAGMINAYSNENDNRLEEERFRLDISSGKKLDLVFTNLLSCYDVSPKGIMENLNPYLTQSDLISKDDFFQEVLQAASHQGDLMYLSNSFYVSTLLCKASLKGVDDHGWTIEKLTKLARDYSDAYLFSPVYGEGIQMGAYNANIVIENALLLYGNKLFDGDASGEKILAQLLDIAKQVYSANNQELITRDALNQGAVLLVPAKIWNFNDLSLYFARDFNKTDMRVVGYPTEDGRGKSVIEPCNGIGILASSEHKDAAWAFIEYYVMFSGSENTDYFSTRKSIFDRQLHNASQKAKQNYEMDDKNYVDEDAIKFLIGMLDNAVGSDQKIEAEIMNIVNEETQSFYLSEKTSEETADVIFRRSEIYLKENCK